MTSDDAGLATAAANGDRAALGAIYDRYADRLYDFSLGMLRDRDAAADCVQDVFVTAATKLAQLREADKLRPWLYAIARAECLARIRERTREQVSEELPDMPSLDAGPETLAAQADLADLVRAASDGLSDRDRVVLELTYRQGLAGPELADALGVTPRNANTLVERLRDTFGRSLGALLVARQGKADPAACAELAAVLADWDGTFTVLMRKRVARHIDDCDVCQEKKSHMVSPAALLGTTPVLVPAPAWLREATLERAGDALPSAPAEGESWWPPGDDAKPSTAWRRRAAIGATIVVLAAGAAAVLAIPRDVAVVPANIPTSTTESTSTTAPVTTTPPRPNASLVPPPPPASTTTPTAIPRTQQPETTTQPPETTTRRLPTTRETTTEAPVTTTRATPTRRTEEPEPEPETEEQEPQQPEQTQPQQTTTKRTVPKPTIDRPPLKTDEPSCPGAPTCPPVFT